MRWAIFLNKVIIMQVTNQKNSAKDFFIHNMAFIILYIAISVFIFKLSKLSSHYFVSIANILLVICGLSIMIIPILIARSMINIIAGKLNEELAKHDFILSQVFFRFSILLFFTVILLWILVLGGVFKSAFSALLTAAPVFFIFASYDKYYSILIELKSESVFKVYFWERLFRIITYFIYILAVLSIDFQYIGNAFDLELIDNPLLSFLDPKSDVIKSSAQYQLMSVVIFFGSIVAIVFPYLSNKRLLRNFLAYFKT